MKTLIQILTREILTLKLKLQCYALHFTIHILHVTALLTTQRLTEFYLKTVPTQTQQWTIISLYS